LGVLNKERRFFEALMRREIPESELELLRHDWKEICGASWERYGSLAKIADHAIFLSYRREPSSAFAERIYDHLYSAFGEGKVFFDLDAIPPGENFRRVIEHQIRLCKVLLIVIGPATINTLDLSGSRRIDQPGDYIRIELNAAMAHQTPIIPALIEGARMPSPEELPIELRDFAFRQAIRVRSNPDFRRDMEVLIQHLERYLKHV
jgi:hypothetical protein